MSSDKFANKSYIYNDISKIIDKTNQQNIRMKYAEINMASSNFQLELFKNVDMKLNKVVEDMKSENRYKNENDIIFSSRDMIQLSKLISKD